MNIPSQINIVDSLINEVAIGKAEIATSLINRGANVSQSGTLSSYADSIRDMGIDYSDPDSVYLNTRPRWWMEVPIPDRDNMIYLLFHCDIDEAALFSGNILGGNGDTWTVDIGYIANGEFILQSSNVYAKNAVAPYVLFDIPVNTGSINLEHNVRQVLCRILTTNNTNIYYWKVSGTSWEYQSPELLEIKARYDNMGQQLYGSSYGAITNAWAIPYVNLVYYQEYGTHADPTSRNTSWQTAVFGGLSRLILLRFNFQLTVWNDSFVEDTSLLCIYPRPSLPTKGYRYCFKSCINLHLDDWDLSGFNATVLGTSDSIFRQTRLREFNGTLYGSIAATFYYCRMLKSVVADCSGVTIYNANTFQGCNNLSCLRLTNMSTSWGANLDLTSSSITFENIDLLADDLPVLLTSRILILTRTPASRNLSDGSAESLAILQKITNKNWTVTL